MQEPAVATRGGKCFYHERRRGLRRPAEPQSPIPLKPSRRHRIAQLLLWITPALWSSNYIIARASDGVIAPHALALGRWTLALALLLPLSGGALVTGFAQWKGEWKQMLLLGALGMWICGAFVYQGAHTTSATNIGLIYAATPVAIAFASTKLLHERFSAWQRAGMALALGGVVFVIAKGDLANLRAVRFTVGDLWILVAAVSWVAYTVLLQRWPSALGPTPRLAAITFGGVLVLLPFAAFEAAFQPGPAFSGKALLLIVLAGLLPGFFSYQAYGYMLRELGAARSSLVMYLAPVYAAFTAWALLGEAPRWYHAVGAALILPAIYLATRKGATH
ncbi:MAG: family transporter [Proteobacteria bacterium]|jgi:drug/metabolite transporter (DMT)-like permease|nr:family transporter [Pseudomonadota bacterium]